MSAGWLAVSRRVLLAVAIVAVGVTVAGLVASISTGDAAWLVLAAVLDLAMLVLVVAKGAANRHRQLGLQIEGTDRMLGQVSTVLQSSSLPALNSAPGGAFDLLRRDLQRDMNAYFHLWLSLQPNNEMPPLGGWAATPETVDALAGLVRRLPADATVVECGSGASTIWLALALERRRAGRLITLEHDRAWAETTQQRLQDTGLAHRAEVRSAPLEETSAGLWYAATLLVGFESIDLLFIDGPPGHVAPQARYPALAQLRRWFRDGTLIVLDDCDRIEEQRTIERWVEESEGKLVPLPELGTGRAAFFAWSDGGGNRSAIDSLA